MYTACKISAMPPEANWKHVPSLLALAVAACISIIWGFSIARGVPGGIMGFPGLYFGTQCLTHHCDPYNPQQLENFYAAAGALHQGESAARTQAVTLYVNLPTTFLFVAPFTLLPLPTAQALWSSLLISSFLIAAWLMWRESANRAPRAALLLLCVLLANCEIVFSGGNTAGLVVALTVIAVWCFLSSRAELLGVLCLAVALTLKPHDSGLVWLYFVLTGGVPRRRALQAAVVAALLTVTAVVWVSLAAPAWLPEMRANLAVINAPGGINEPGPTSIGVNSADMIIDLQTVFSIVRNSPPFYNAATYLTCGILFLAWARAVLRARFTPETAWLALSSAAALSMLITYHRSYDAKLLLLAIPACTLLRAENGATAKIALALTAMTVFFTADIPLTIVSIATAHLPITASGIFAKFIAITLGRPAPLLLLLTAAFYLWAFTRNLHSSPESNA